MVREGSARMKAKILLTGILIFCGNAYAETAKDIGRSIGEVATSQPAREAGKAVTETSQAALMTILCNGEGMFSRAAQCYMTPSGKQVWELEGSDKTYWMKQAMADGRHKRMETMRQEKLKKSHRDFCTFWLDQEVTERSARKIGKYCH